MQSPAEHAPGHQPKGEIMQHTHALDIHQTVTMRAFLDLEQALEAAVLACTRGKRLDHPHIGKHIRQFAAEVGGTIGIKPVPRHAASAQPDERARSQQNESEQGGDQMPIYGGQHRQSGAKIGAYRSDIEQRGREDLLQRIPGG